MLIRCALALALWPSFAFGQVYLVEPKAADCLTRSAAQCTAFGCDGVLTKYWWDCDLLAQPTDVGGVSGTGGTTALVIIPGTPQGTAGLTEAEIAAIQTEEQLGAALGERKSVNP
jgi:hypothetical protein